LEYTQLGKSGLTISRLSFGAATFGLPTSMDLAIGRIGVVEHAGAQRLVSLCRDAGINYFDTADVYSSGDAELILGEALKPCRQEVVIGTKSSMPMGPLAHDRGTSRRHLIQSCEDSLRRLQTDWIDLYQIHYPDYLTPVEETIRALDDLVRSGKVRYIGCSNFSAWHMMRHMAVADALGLERFISHQISYSLIERDTEYEIVPAAIDQGVGLLAWGPLSGGFLSGKYKRGEPPPPGSRFADLPNYPAPPDPTKAYDVIDTLRQISQAGRRTVSQVALNWVLRRPWVSSAIVGARNEEQLVASLKAAEWALTAEEVAILDRVSATPIPYPYRIQQQINGDRTPSLPTFRR